MSGNKYKTRTYYTVLLLQIVSATSVVMKQPPHFIENKDTDEFKIDVFLTVLEYLLWL